MYDVFKKDIVDSTNEWAKRDNKFNVIYLANSQSKGKGRGKNSWISPKGNLYFSLKLKANSYKEAKEATFIMSIAIVRAIKELYNLEVKIKWPNDIFLDGKKLSGVLSEIQESDNKLFLIVGVGINCNFNDNSLKDIAISLHKYVKNSNKELFLEKIIEKFDYLFSSYKENGFKYILDIWKKHTNIFDEKMLFTSINGEKKLVKVISLNNDASLNVKDKNDKEHVILAGDIEYVKKTDN